jgi:Sortilin, neurotensin receptor 3,
MGVRSLKIGAVCLLASLSMFSTSRAFAHATPHVLEILFRANGYVLLSNRGLIFGDKDRSNWRLMCAEALGINTSEVPSMVELPDGRLMVATSRGLQTTSDDGCSWQAVAPFGTTSVPALAKDPTDPKRIYLSAYSADPMMSMSGIYVTEDGGTNWTKLLAAPNERDYAQTIVVAPKDPKRVYASGRTWDMMGNYSHYVSVSKDAGKTWERMAITLEKDELEVQLFAVSPMDSQIVVARAGGSNPMVTPERLLVSKDGGKTFTSPFKMLLLSGLAFSADGSKAWVVGQDGFFESTDGLATFQRVGTAESMSYVTERDGELLACGYYTGIGSGDNGVGMMKPTGGGFMSFMQLDEVKAPVACDASSTTAMKCATWWTDWVNELMAGQFTAGDGGLAGSAGSLAAAGAGGSTTDAGVASEAGAAGLQPSAAGAAGTGAASAGSGGGGGGRGGCSISVAKGGKSSGSFALVTALLALATVLRRRVRRPRGL